MDTIQYRNEPLPQGPPSEPTPKTEPLIVSGSNLKPKNNSPHVEREQRARALAAAWGGTITDFVRAHYVEIIQVREDFLHKAKSKSIFGCNTWEQYVEERLHCSPQHMRRLLAGDNPATSIYDGTAHRQSTPVVDTTSTEETDASSPNRIPTAADMTSGVEDETPEAEPAKGMTAAEYTEALIEARLGKLASVVARKSVIDLIPGKFFVYGAGGMDKANGQMLRAETELLIKESMPTIYEAIIRVAQRQLAELPVMPKRVLTCPNCGNQETGTIESLGEPKNGSSRYQCQKCDHRASTRKFKLLPPMQATQVETPVQPEPTNSNPRRRQKKHSSPAGMVNIDELPPEARARVMAQIESVAAD